MHWPVFLCFFLTGVYFAWAQQKNLFQTIAAAKKKGLTGYALVDASDLWFGRNGAPYEVPRIAVDAFGNRDDRATIEDWKMAKLPDGHFPYFDKNGDGILDDHEANSWWFQRKPAATMNLSEVLDPPKGHKQRLGSWKDPLSTEGMIYTKPYPHPREFWSKHMDGYKPALLKGAQHGWPCMNWTREELKRKYGWVDAKLEPKVESRGNDTGYADLDALSKRHRLNVSEYLRVEDGKNVYVVSILPQAMAWEVAHPSVLLCGSRKTILNKRSPPPYTKTKHPYPNELGYPWMTHIFEANLWIASGFTRSQFHYDKEWNVNCLLSGKKRWFFLNPFWYEEGLQWARGNQFRKDSPLNNRWTDWVYLDPDHVDLIVQHKLRNMDYYELIQEAGDCIFIPYAMLHQVEKIGDDTQVAASWMFLPETIYEEKDCMEAPLQEDLPLAVMDTLYAYSGSGIIPQGYPDPLEFVNNLVRSMRQAGESVLSFRTFKEAVTNGDSVLATVKNGKKRSKALFKLINSYAKDPSVGLRVEELYESVPLRIWCKPAAEGDEEGPLPCDHGEEYQILDDKELGKMRDHIEQLEKGERRSADSKPALKLSNSRVPKGRPPRAEL